MPVQLTDTEIDFIQRHLSEDVNKILLGAHKNKQLDIRKMAAQILARQKASKKLPEWCANPELFFPPPLSIEQASSQATALYKARLAGGQTLIDITGGTGIDIYYMSRNFRQASYLEMNPEVWESASYNFEKLGAEKISAINDDSLSFLAKHPEKYDWLYCDPARRGAQQEKVVLLSSCTPDVVSNLDLLYRSADNIMIKTSPLLDIDLAVKELGGVSSVHIVGSGNECKELLFILKKDSNSVDRYQKTAVVPDDNGNPLHELTFSVESEQHASVQYANPLKYLYEPHAAILKAGFYKSVAMHFNLMKIAPNSHLYTSDILIDNFPGRTFKITGTCKPDRKSISAMINEDKANITIRNFPGTVEEFRKKSKLKDGGNYYLFLTTLENQKHTIIVTEKIIY